MLIEPKNVSHIVFDFDGVIAETDSARFDILKDILKDYRIKLEDNYKLQDIVGTPTDIFLKANFDSLSDDAINRIVKKRRHIYLNNLEKYCRPYPSAIKTIGELKKANYKLHLATTNDLHVVEKLLKHLKLFESFESIFYREKIVDGNTNQKDYRLFINESNINPSFVVVIEDSILGVRAAKKANLPCIAFDTFNNSELRKYADLTVSSYAELGDFFGLKAVSPQRWA